MLLPSHSLWHWQELPNIRWSLRCIYIFLLTLRSWCLGCINNNCLWTVFGSCSTVLGNNSLQWWHLLSSMSKIATSLAPSRLLSAEATLKLLRGSNILYDTMYFPVFQQASWLSLFPNTTKPSPQNKNCFNLSMDNIWGISSSNMQSV